MILMSTWKRHGTKENDYAAEFLWIGLDFYYLCIYRLVYRGILRCTRYRKVREPWIFKRSVLSDLWVRRGDCCGHPDTSERKSADPVCRIFSSHLCAGVHYGLYSGKSISQQVVGLFWQAIQHQRLRLPEVFDLLGTGMYLYHGYHSSDHLCSHPLYSVRAWHSVAQYYHVRVRGRLHHHGDDDSEIQ